MAGERKLKDQTRVPLVPTGKSEEQHSVRASPHARAPTLVRTTSGWTVCVTLYAELCMEPCEVVRTELCIELCEELCVDLCVELCMELSRLLQLVERTCPSRSGARLRCHVMRG